VTKYAVYPPADPTRQIERHHLVDLDKSVALTVCCEPAGHERRLRSLSGWANLGDSACQECLAVVDRPTLNAQAEHELSLFGPGYFWYEGNPLDGVIVDFGQQ
jgi:hypothetical protein